MTTEIIDFGSPMNFCFITYTTNACLLSASPQSEIHESLCDKGPRGETPRKSAKVCRPKVHRAKVHQSPRRENPRGKSPRGKKITKSTERKSMRRKSMKVHGRKSSESFGFPDVCRHSPVHKITEGLVKRACHNWLTSL